MDSDGEFSSVLDLRFKIGNLKELYITCAYDYDFHETYENQFYFTYKCENQTRYISVKSNLTGLNTDEISFIKNIKDNLLNYLRETLIFMFDTDYIDNLPKAYTFLLCNSFVRQFPRDIAKLITHKILFFKK